MELHEVINKRTSVRSYKDTPVTKEQLDILLKSAVRAPSACNYQSWHYYAVCSKPMIDAFHPEISNIPWIKDISLIIVVCIVERNANILTSKFGERGRMFAIQETAAAIENILLTAGDLGLGGCWIGPMNVEKCKEHLAISDNHTPIAILTIGTPASDIPPRDRKPIEDVTTIIGTLSEGTLTESDEKEKSDEQKLFKLEHASLPESVFDDLNLANATFNNINLQGAKFSDINMSETTYTGLTMAGAEFGCVELIKARFENPDLSESEFINCSMKNVKLENCDITGMTIDGISVAEAIEKLKSSK